MARNSHYQKRKQQSSRPSTYQTRKSSSPPTSRHRGKQQTGGFNGLPPSLRAALITSSFVGVIAVINSFSAGTALIFTFPIQLIIYMITGALAAKFALADGYEEDRVPTVGAQAGFFNWILPAVIYLLLSLVGISIGIGLFGIAAWILCGPVDLGIQVVMAALGAWIYKNVGK